MSTIIYYSKEFFISPIIKNSATRLSLDFFHYHDLNNFYQLNDLISSLGVHKYFLLFHTPSYSQEKDQLDEFLKSFDGAGITYTLFPNENLRTINPLKFEESLKNFFEK